MSLGGAKERVGLEPWRRRLRLLDEGRKTSTSTSTSTSAIETERPAPRLALVHLIQRSFGPLSGNDTMAQSTEGSNYSLVTSPKSGVSLLSLGDFEAQFEAAKERTARRIQKLKQRANKHKDLPRRRKAA